MKRKSGYPYWYDTTKEEKQCDCQAKQVITKDESGKSDSVFLEYTCEECGKKWYRYIEG